MFKEVCRRGFALTSFILSLASLFSMVMIFFFAIAASYEGQFDLIVGLLALFVMLLTVLGIVFGSISLRTSKGKGFAIAGFTMNITIILVLTLILVIGFTIGE